MTIRLYQFKTKKLLLYQLFQLHFQFRIRRSFGIIVHNLIFFINNNNPGNRSNQVTLCQR